MRFRVALSAAVALLASLLPSGALAHASAQRAHVSHCPAHSRGHSRRTRQRCPRRHAKTYSVERRAFDTSAPAPLVPGNCDLFAAPSGSDAAGSGTSKRPFASLTKLDSALKPGQTGCLEAGTYGTTRTWHQIDTSGTDSGRITLAAYPGASVTVVGYVDIEAGYTTLEGLNIDGSNLFYNQERAGTACPYPVSQPLVIAGRGDILQYDNYYQSVPSLRGNGIGIGFWGNADDTIIRYDKIHDVGQCQAYDHLIYLSHGDNVQIYDNWMWNDQHGRGVQLYPAPTNARVHDNVVDQAGEGFAIGDESGDTVSGNQIYHNIVMDSTGLSWQGIPGEMIHDYYGGAPGAGNMFYDNLSYGNVRGVGSLTAVASYGNTVATPRFVNAAAHDFAVESSSPAAGWGLWNGQ
jgi:hypothetical protein